MPEAAELESTARLLADVFPGSSTASATYLDWQYVRNPAGVVVETNLDDDQGRAGHYAVIPVTLSEDGAPLRAALSLNTAVDARARGGGVFVKLAQQTYDAAAGRGIEAIVGVANANSTPGFVRRLGFDLLTRLPARVWPRRPGGRAVESTVADALVLADDAFWARLDPLLHAPASGLAFRWDRPALTWRLQSPRGPYAVHLGDGAAALSVRSRGPGGAPVAVVLKVLPVEGAPAAVIGALFAAACRHHRAVAAVHAGVVSVDVPAGIPLPERFKPSPLNVIFRRLPEPGDRPRGRFAALEFLDFDAY